LVVGCALVVSCSAPELSTSRAPVIGGSPASDPAVVAIHGRRTVCDDSVPAAACSGTLIAKRVVLTAGHCVEPEVSGKGYEVVFGDVSDKAAQRLIVVQIAHHPKYRRAGYVFDVALLLLGDEAPVTPVALSEAPAVPVVGDLVRAVGFGVSSADDKPGIKREGVMAVRSIGAETFESTPSPGMSCVGDSGGPVFLLSETGPQTLIGVTSSGDTPCKEYARNYRVDAVRDFIDPFVERANMLPKGPPKASIGPESFCSAPCAASSECPAGLLCSEQGVGVKRCVLPGIVPGTFGERCSTKDPCAAGESCVRFWTSGDFECLCHRPCSGGPTPPPPLDGGIPAPPGSASPAEYRAGGGGCAHGRATTSSWGWLAALAWITARRSRAR